MNSDNYMVEMFLDMVRVDSESGDEHRFLDFIRRILVSDLGAHCETDCYGNLICNVRATGKNGALPVLLCAHGDTVAPGKRIEPVVRGGVIYSAGNTILGADDKAGIAEIIGAVMGAKTHPPLEILITRGEETGLVGARHLDTSMVEAKMGFVVDGLDLDTVVVGGPSHINVDVSITGRTAHPSIEPEKGVSAIRVAAKAISALHEGRIDEETTVSVGTLHAGTVRNAVPEQAFIEAECRSMNHDKCVRQARIMAETFEAVAADVGATAQVSTNLQYRAYRVESDTRVVRLAADAIAASGLEPRVKTIMGGSDAFVLSQKGIDSVVIGYGGKAVHSVDEHIAIADMEKAAAIICHVLESVS
jgi:tripeptide aminopeptidase